MRRLIDQHPLRRGSHPNRDDGMCAMEMVAWLAGEPHSDEPSCACPVLAAFTRACNDAMDDDTRDRLLRPLVPLLVNTRGSFANERERGMLVVDTLVRRLLPIWLRHQRRADEARRLADLPPLRHVLDVRTALVALDDLTRDHHATRWVLLRALEGMHPARFVAGAVQVAKASGDLATWNLVAGLVERMAAVGVASDEVVTN